jgi:hypothetical protein
MRNTAEKIRLVIILAFIAGSVYAGFGAYHFAQSLNASAARHSQQF